MFSKNLQGKIFSSCFSEVLIIINFIACLEARMESAKRQPEFRYFSYQRSMICNAAHQPMDPKSLQDIQQIVIQALSTNTTVKPLGHLHSLTDIICTDGIPINMMGINHFRYDATTKLASVGAGSTIGNFLEQLHKMGRTIYGIPTYEDITVGGALGTGAHGTNFWNPSSLSDQIVSVVAVDGMGNVRNITSGVELNAFKANLGLLGILYEVTFSTTPQYKLHIRNFPVSDRILWQHPNRILELAASNELFYFFWYPTSKRVVLFVGNRVPTNTHGNCETHFISEMPRASSASLSKSLETMQDAGDYLGYFVFQMYNWRSLYKKLPMRSPMFTKENGKTVCSPAIGYSHKMSTNRCKECSWNHGSDSVNNVEIAATIPLSELHSAVKTIKSIFSEYPMEFPVCGILFRFLSASNGLLALSSGRPSVSIEWVLVARTKDRFTKPMLGLTTSQIMLSALVHKHDGRPHWGKNGLLFTQQKILLKRFPSLPKFISHMEKFDPHGVFLNDFGRRLRFGSTKTSMDIYAKHCALVDNCICQRDEDCGDGKDGSYICGIIKGYRVCKVDPNSYQSYRGRVLRKVLKSLGFFLT